MATVTATTAVAVVVARGQVAREPARVMEKEAVAAEVAAAMEGATEAAAAAVAAATEGAA